MDKSFRDRDSRRLDCPAKMRTPLILPALHNGLPKPCYGPKIKAVGADRGFDSQANQIGLEEDKIYNGVCPRSPRQLQERMGSWKFKGLQRRRAQTEGRVAILKNVFLGGRMRAKGFSNRERMLTWTVLA
ncbi:MAG: hypothetical protein ACRD41_14815, partial [Candidatus Acidiferrales bacterium]